MYIKTKRFRLNIIDLLISILIIKHTRKLLEAG